MLEALFGQLLRPQVDHLDLPLLFLDLLGLAVQCLHRDLLLLLVADELFGAVGHCWLHLIDPSVHQASLIPNLVDVVLAGVEPLFVQ